MTNTVLIKRSGTANSAPTAGQLLPGELAINYADGNLFYKNSSNVVTVIASNQFVSVTGNVTGNYFIGNGSQLTGITVSAGAAIINGNSNVSVAANGNVTVGVTGVPNIAVFTPIGLGINGNIETSGNIYAGIGANVNAGNLNAVGLSLSGTVLSVLQSTSNITTTANVTGNYFLGNGALLTGVITSVANINNGSSNITVVSSGGNITAGIGGTSNVVVWASTGEYVTGVVSATGNITGAYIIGNGSALTAITGSNVVGNVAQAVHAYFADTANAVTGSNVSGQVANALIAGTVYTAAQPNITSVGILTSVSSTGNIDGANINGNGSGLASLTGGNVVGNVAQAVHAYFADTANAVTGSNVSGQVANALVAGTVYTAAQPNITTVGTLSSLTVTGNITGGNLNAGGMSLSGNVVSVLNVTGNIAGGNIFGSNVITTGAVSAASVSSSGNVTGANINTTGVVSANTAQFATAAYANAAITDRTQLATKFYVDNQVAAGINIHDPVVATTTGNLTATYTPGGTTPTWTDIVDNKTLVTASAHGLVTNDQITFFVTTNGVVANLAYFVYDTPNATSITLSEIWVGPQITNLTNGTGLSITSRAKPGVGATLTNTGAQAALTLDGVALTLSDRVLVKDQTTTAQNGIYVVTDVGSGSSDWILTRSSDTNQFAPQSPTGLSAGDYVYVDGGLTEDGTSYVQTTNAYIIIGTTGLTYTQFSGTVIYTGTSPITITGQTIALANTTGTGNTVVLSTSPSLVTPNIGAATGTSVSVTGNVIGGNVTTAGIISAGSVSSGGNVIGANLLYGTGQVSGTGNIYANNIAVTNQISATGNLISNLGLYVGAGASSTGLTNPIIVAQATGLAYIQVAAKNTAATGSADFVAYADNGTEETAWVDMGMTGSGFNDTAYTITNANDGYIFVQGNTNGAGGNLVLATGALGTAADIVFATGGFLDANEKMRFINSTGQFDIETTTAAANTTTGALRVRGGAGVAGNIYAGGLVSVTGNIVTTANVSGGNVLTGGEISATGNITGGNIMGGANVNATTHTGTTVSVTGNVTGGNIVTSGAISTTANVVGGNVNTNVVSGTGTTIKSTGDLNLSATGNITLNNTYINNLAEPVQNQDAATKYYVDTTAQGLHIHDSANLASTTDLATYTGATVTYSNGASGVGATLSLVGNTLTTLDGTTLVGAPSSTRLLIKNQANAVQNGMYNYTSSSLLTRSSDYDTTAEAAGGDFLFVTTGATQADTGWVQTTDNPTIGTDPIVFTQFSGAGTYTANTAAGLIVNGTVFSAKVDNTTTAFDGGGNIVVKASAALTTPNIGAATGTSLSTTGNINSAGNISGNYIFGNGSQLTGIVAGSNYGDSNVAAYLPTYTGSLPNLTGVVTTTANITGGNILTGGLISATGNIVSTANVSGGNVLSSDLIQGVTLSASGNVNGGNLTTSQQVSATGNITGGNIISVAVVSAASLSASGNVTGGNLSIVGNIITGGNVTTNEPNANLTIDPAGTGYAVFTATTPVVIANTSGIALSVAGNITGGNLLGTFVGDLTGTTVSVTGNITGGNLNAAGLSLSSNVVSALNLSSSLTAATTISAVGNITGGNLNGAGLSLSSNVVSALNLSSSLTTATTISAVGNITGGNVIGGANVYAITHTGTTVSVTANINGGNIISAATVSAASISASGNVTVANLIINGTAAAGFGVLSVSGNIQTTTANNTSNIGNASNYFNTVHAKATTAQYADVAELYEADAPYPPGTVLIFGGALEVTAQIISHSSAIAGVVSENPSHLMNAGLQGQHAVAVALLGRVPCQVKGTIRKGDLLVASDTPGVAQRLDFAQYTPGCIIGKSLENYNSDQVGKIEIAVGIK
jgi:hypothetical protein